jgi:hypothetical protein
MIEGVDVSGIDAGMDEEMDERIRMALIKALQPQSQEMVDG